ncbi:MAG: hypothetical protein C0596_18825 [Marinilabiliales bacterium]|nr:MAG: hypothetical protein C0596_18825 [Marinilabiliales bacterium]
MGNIPCCYSYIIMKKVIIILTLLFLVVSTKSQTLFNRNYINTDDNSSENWICSAMFTHNNNYYLIGGYSSFFQEGTLVYRGICIVKIDSLGVIDTIHYHAEEGRDIYEGWNKCFALNSDSFAMTGGIFTDATIGGYLTVYNYDLDTIISKELFLDTISDRNFGMISVDGGYVFCGSIDTSRNAFEYPETVYNKVHLYKTDLSGNPVWSKTFSFGDISDGCWSSASRLVQAADSGFILIGNTNDFGNYRNFILKTDSLGNQQWVKFYGSTTYDNPAFQDIITTKDSCYIVCGAYTYGEAFGGLYPYDGWIIKIDNDGNSKWNKKYREHRIDPGDYRDSIYCQFYSACELPNGNIAVTGTARKETGYSNRTPFLYMMYENGDTVFSRHYFQYPVGHPDYVNVSYPNAVMSTDDGGLAIGGWAEFIEYDDVNEQWINPQRIFLIKIDSLGNDTLVNNILPYQTQPITKFELPCYPNPAVNEFYVDISYKTGDDVLEIYSTNGTIIHEQAVVSGENRIDICGLKPGMYLVRLRNSRLFGKITIQ